MSIVRVICSSIQGEGTLAGVPATFVFSHDSEPRVTWCDLLRDPWTPEVDSTLGDLLVNIRRRGNNHVVIAGVETHHVEELAPLCTGLREHEYHTTVEVSGATPVDLDCDVMNVNIVLKNPTVPRKAKNAAPPYDVEAVRAIVAAMPYCLKFEVADRAEMEELHTLVMEVGAGRDQVVLQPALVAAKDQKAQMQWLMEASRFFGYRIGQRLPMPPPDPKPKK